MSAKIKYDEKWKERLEPFAQAEAERYHQVVALIDAMSVEELRQIVEDATYPTQTNCWWATYRVVDEITAEANFRLRQIAEAAPEPDDLTT